MKRWPAERLRSLLQEEPDLEIVAECGDGNSAIALIQSEEPDLVFLDIQMPEVDGFGVVEELQKQGNLPLTIFVTAYDRYAMRAFEVHALDYLLKPVNKERLRRGAGPRTQAVTEPIGGMFQKRVLEMLGGPRRPAARARAHRGEVGRRDRLPQAPTKSTGQSRREITCACMWATSLTSCAKRLPHWKIA